MQNFPKLTFLLIALFSLGLLQNCTKDKDEPIPPPIAKFTFTSDNGFEAPSVVTFTNSSTGATAFEWNFGDGSAKITTENASHEYTSPGTYSVTLIAKNGSVSNTASETVIVVSPAPIAAFTFISDNNFTNPSTITFINTSSNASSYEWDFGDGSSASTEENPSHTYNSTGEYTVTLNAISDTKTDEETATIAIVPEAPIANFTFTSKNDFHTPSVVIFTNTSTSAMTYVWDFGDGSATSTEVNPEHNYTTTGNYIVTLTATNETLEDTKMASIDITPSQPTADFTYVSNNDFHTPSEITFTNTSEHAASYVWDFGDGSATSTAENPTHTYTATGSYTVTLTAVNETLTDIKTVVIEITPYQPEAAFTHVSNNGYIAPTIISFTNTSVNAASVSWDFGDGSATTSTNNPDHTYTTPGTYTVTLTATNETLMDVETQVITVSAMAYTGVYKLNVATITEDVFIDGVLFPVGTDVTAEAQALFDVVACGNPADRVLDLQFTGNVVFVCFGPNNETTGGTWSGNPTTRVISISLTSPPYPGSFTLSIENAGLTGNSLTGDLIDTVLPGALFGLPGSITVSLTLQLLKQ